MIVVPGTSDIHTDTFAQSLGCEVSTSPIQSDWAFFVGVSDKNDPQKWKDQGTKTCAYWIGSDSLCAYQDANYRRSIQEYDCHIAVHERIREELKAWGVSSHVVYPCARRVSEGLPIAKEKNVGVYMPEPNLYCLKECIQIAKENPAIPFSFYGMLFDLPTDLPNNIKPYGRLSPEESADLQDSFSVMLRITTHDGNPVGGIEMKQRNRHVIENYPYKGFLFAKSIESANVYLRDPLVHRGDFLDNDMPGPWSYWYRDVCSKESFKKNVHSILT